MAPWDRVRQRSARTAAAIGRGLRQVRERLPTVPRLELKKTNWQPKGQLTMDSFRISTITHLTFAFLLLALSIASVLTVIQIAVKPGPDRGNLRMLNRANALGWMETIVAVLATLTGLWVMVASGRPLSETWLWASLAVMVFYSASLLPITKPPRMRLAEGGTTGRVGMQVLLHVAYMLLLLFTFALMLVKPR
jgi:hypothetical protein